MSLAKEKILNDNNCFKHSQEFKSTRTFSGLTLSYNLSTNRTRSVTNLIVNGSLSLYFRIVWFCQRPLNEQKKNNNFSIFCYHNTLSDEILSYAEMTFITRSWIFALSTFVHNWFERFKLTFCIMGKIELFSLL